MTARRYGAQSMTAPLREVLVKRPGPAIRPGVRRPGARLPPSGRPRRRAARARRVRRDAGWLGPNVHVLDDRARRPRPRLHLRPAARHGPRRHPAAARQAEPGGRAGDARGVDRRPPASRRSGGSRRPARSRAATRSGCGPTCSASGGRCGPTTHGVAPARRRWSAATSASSTSRTGAARPSSIHLMSVISPVADDLAVVYLPLLPVGLWELLGELGHPPGRGARGGVRDARLQRPRGPARASSSWPRATRGTARGAGRGRLRGPHLPGDRDRGQRLRRPDLHDPADPA